MHKLAKLIAAVHAGVAAVSTLAAPASAQEAAEVRAYMEAVRLGTPEAITQFLQSYPNSQLPGSELGAKIASSIGTQPTAPASAAQSTPSRPEASPAGPY